MTSVISFKLLILWRHRGLERHVLPKCQFQAGEEQGLEVKKDLSAQPGAHTASPWGLFSKLGERPAEQPETQLLRSSQHTRLSKPIQVFVLFSIDGINDQAREITKVA